MFASRTRFTVRFTHVFFYCVLCIILQCSNILQLQYVSVGYTSPVFLLLLLVGFLIIGNYTAASVEKCGLNSNTCVVVAVLTSPSIDLECYQLFAILCLCLRVRVCTCDDCLGSWVWLLELATIILCLLLACFLMLLFDYNN